MFIHDIIKIEYIRQGYLPDYPYHLISDKEMFDAFICDEIIVSKDDALKIKQGDSSLWESPKKYVTLHGLSYFEFIVYDDKEALLIRGSKDKLSQFRDILGIVTECKLSEECYFAVNYPLPEGLDDEYNNLVSSISYHISAYFEMLERGEEAVLPDWVYSYMNGSVIGPNSPQLDIHDLLVMINLDNIDDKFTLSAQLSCLEISKKWVDKLPPSKNVMRPPTMYGEPHVIKSLRISGLLADVST